MRVVRAADQVVEGDVEVVGEGNGLIKGCRSARFFNITDKNFCCADGLSYLTLREIPGFSKGKKSLRKNARIEQKNTPFTVRKKRTIIIIVVRDTRTTETEREER